MSQLLTTVSSAIALTALAVAIIGQSAETVPLPRPRPAPVPQLPLPLPPDQAVEYRWPKPVGTIRFVQTNAVPPDVRAATAQAGREAPARIETANPPRVIATSEGPRRRVKRERQERNYAYDICRGKGRTYTDNGRSWRCRR